MHSHYVAGFGDDVVGSEVLAKFNASDCSFCEQFNSFGSVNTLKECLVLLHYAENVGSGGNCLAVSQSLIYGCIEVENRNVSDCLLDC